MCKFVIKPTDATYLGESVMSQSDVKADKNACSSRFASTESLFSEEFRYLDSAFYREAVGITDSVTSWPPISVPY